MSYHAAAARSCPQGRKPFPLPTDPATECLPMLHSGFANYDPRNFAIGTWNRSIWNMELGDEICLTAQRGPFSQNQSGEKGTFCLGGLTDMGGGDEDEGSWMKTVWLNKRGGNSICCESSLNFLTRTVSSTPS